MTDSQNRYKGAGYGPIFDLSPEQTLDLINRYPDIFGDNNRNTIEEEQVLDKVFEKTIDPSLLRNTVKQVANRKDLISDPDRNYWTCLSVFYDVAKELKIDISIFKQKNASKVYNKLYELSNNENFRDIIREVNATEAQRLANQGSFIIASWHSTARITVGHIGIVIIDKKRNQMKIDKRGALVGGGGISPKSIGSNGEGVFQDAGYITQRGALERPIKYFVFNFKNTE